MGIKEKISDIVLILTTIILIGMVGILGFIIYGEITGNAKIIINFEGEAGYPYIDFVHEDNAQSNTDLEINMSGIIGNEIKEKNKTNYLYDQLDATAKSIYNKLYSNKENLKTGIYTIEFGEAFSEVLSQENGDEELQKQYQSAIEVLLYENPDIFYLDATNMYLNIEKTTRITGVKYNVYIDNGKKTSYLAEGFYTKEDVDKAEQEIQEVRDSLLLALDGRSDYEKIKIIHNYLINNIEYDETLLETNIYDLYGALVNGKCVCEGYAKAFQYLMDEAEIDNVIVIGKGTNSNDETENHAWNYVELHGKWYAVDVTWDDPIIIGGGKLSEKSRYQYFLRGSVTMQKDHIASGKFTDAGKTFSYPTLNIKDYE